LQAKQKVGTIRQKVLIPGATPEDIYGAFLSSKGHSAMTGTKSSISARKGAKFSAGDGYISGKNVELVKGKKIVQEWQTSEWPEDYGPSTLEINLREKGDGTELSLIQTNVPKSQVEYYEKGWEDFYWKPMKEYFGKNSRK